MAARTPKPGDILVDVVWDEAVVVADGWSVLDALVEIVMQNGCPGTAEELRTNPVLVKTAADYQIETWWYCTAAYRELWGIEERDVPGWGWWAHDGDGKRSIRVVALRMSGCDLAERCEDAAAGAAVS